MQISSFFSYPGQETASESTEEDVLIFLPDHSDEDWQTLLDYTEALRFHIGDLVINQGETDRGLYFVVEGQLEVLALSPQQESWRWVADLAPGSVFGEQAFFDGKPRSAAVRAISDGSLLRLNPEAFERLAGHHPMLAQAILFDLARILSLRLRQLS